MEKRTVLICERSTAFVDQIRPIFRELGLRPSVVSSKKALIKSIRTGSPAIIFIGVEMPRKGGFTFFSEVKQLARHTPIVMVTSTVTPEEMRIHQTLPVHADAYLDKRTLDSSRLVSALNGMLKLNLRDHELERLASRYPFTRPGARSGREESLEEEIEQSITWDEGGGTEERADHSRNESDPEFIQSPRFSAGANRASSGAGSAKEGGEPEDQADVEQLKKELEELRCAVKATPFSEEYRSLKCQARKFDEELSMLREQFAEQSRQVRGLEGKLVDAEFQVRSLSDSEASAQEQVRSLEEKLGQAAEARVSLQHEWAQSMEALKLSAEDEKLQAVNGTMNKMKSEMEALRKKHAEEMAQTTSKARADSAKATEAREAAWRDQVAKLKSEHAKALKTMEEKHARDCERLFEEHSRKLLEKEHEFNEAMIRATEEHEKEIAAKAMEWRVRVQQVEKEFDAKRMADRTALEERYRKELQQLRAHHAKDRERLQRMHTEGLESMSARLRDSMPDPAKIKNPLLRAKLEEKLKEREAELAAEMKAGAGEP